MGNKTTPEAVNEYAESFPEKAQSARNAPGQVRLGPNLANYTFRRFAAATCAYQWPESFTVRF